MAHAYDPINFGVIAKPRTVVALTELVKKLEGTRGRVSREATSACEPITVAPTEVPFQNATLPPPPSYMNKTVEERLAELSQLTQTLLDRTAKLTIAHDRNLGWMTGDNCGQKVISCTCVPPRGMKRGSIRPGQIAHVGRRKN